MSLADLDDARAKDKLSGKDLSLVFLDDMLNDPVVQLVMKADGVSEAQLRHLYLGKRTTQTDMDDADAGTENATAQGPSRDASDIHDAENEGMPCRPRTSSVSV